MADKGTVIGDVIDGKEQGINQIKYTGTATNVVISDIVNSDNTICYYMSDNPNVIFINNSQQLITRATGASTSVQLFLKPLPSDSAITATITGYCKSPNKSNTIEKTIEVRQTLDSVKVQDYYEYNYGKLPFNLSYTVTPSNAYLSNVEFTKTSGDCIELNGTHCTVSDSGFATIDYSFVNGTNVTKTGSISIRINPLESSMGTSKTNISITKDLSTTITFTTNHCWLYNTSTTNSIVAEAKIAAGTNNVTIYGKSVGQATITVTGKGDTGYSNPHYVEITVNVTNVSNGGDTYYSYSGSPA